MGIGDLFVIEGCGAYCSSMSTKNYNSFPEAAEVLHRADGSLALIRRRQPVEQIWMNEIPVPASPAGGGGGGKRTLSFSKYHGLGNDFILIDNRGQTEPLVTSAEAEAVCRHHFGIGADGVIFA